MSERAPRSQRRGDSDDAETATMVRGALPTPPLSALVHVLGAQAQPESFRLTSRCFVGSGAGCQIVISEPTVSRAHVELELAPEGVMVRDLGSHNGTFYLDQRVENIVLSFGGRVRLGASAVLAIDVDRASLSEIPPYAGDRYAQVIGRSPAMKQIFGVLARLEGSLATVVLEGESGTGKEVIAEAIHSQSGVGRGPLVIVNCGAIPRDLVASELFGHVRGAFTGAVDVRRGAFESADGGTIFLDEVGELPLELQPVLLRVLEKGEVRPVGSDSAKAVRVRVIAATNRDLELEVREGRFREDLFYRLAVVRLRVPPLGQRPEDIELLAHKFAAEAGVPALPPEVVQKLVSRSWPGNVRELRNAVQAYAALGVLPEPTRSKPATLELALRELVEIGMPYAEHKEILTERFTKIFLEALLEKTGGNRTVAARLAGLDRTHLTRLLAKYGMLKSSGRGS